MPIKSSVRHRQFSVKLQRLVRYRHTGIMVSPVPLVTDQAVSVQLCPICILYLFTPREKQVHTLETIFIFPRWPEDLGQQQFFGGGRRASLLHSRCSDLSHLGLGEIFLFTLPAESKICSDFAEILTKGSSYFSYNFDNLFYLSRLKSYEIKRESQLKHLQQCIIRNRILQNII